MSRLSIVWASSPLLTSTTTIAISAAEPPLIRRFANTSWPGVSITSKPGTGLSDFDRLSNNFPVIFLIVSIGK